MPVITCKAYPDLRMTIAPLEIIHAMIKEAYFATATIDEVQIPGNTTTPTQEYIVVSGDTLGGIATKYQTSVAAIIHHDPNYHVRKPASNKSRTKDSNSGWWEPGRYR